MKHMALAYVFVAIGGALGAMSRYALHVWLQRDYVLPIGTLSANLLGCLLLCRCRDCAGTLARSRRLGWGSSAFLENVHDRAQPFLVFRFHQY